MQRVRSVCSASRKVWFVFLLGIVFSLMPAAIAQQASIKPNLLAGKRVLWLGDSITQAGDYVTFVQYFLDKQYPSDSFDIVSIGLASETTSCLSEKEHPFPRPCVQERLQRALTLVKPDVVVACYGMNDGIYHPQSSERMAAFEAGIHKLISVAKAAHASVVLLTPPPFDSMPLKNLADIHAPDFGYKTPYAGYDHVLEDYAHWEMQLPKTDASVVINLHGPMDAYLKKQRETNPGFTFAVKDGIHPNAAGHLLMARLVLAGLGVSVSHEELDVELERVQADPLYALVKSQREARSAGWLKYVGYTRESRVKVDSIADVEHANTSMQAQIDQVRKHQ